MNIIVLYVLSAFKSLWINYRYLPLKQAIKMPLLVAYDTFVYKVSVGLFY